MEEGLMLLVVADGAGDEHLTGPGHPERPERIDAALAGIDDARLEDTVTWMQPRPARRDELLAVHDAAYLDELEAFCRAGGGPLDPDTTVSSGSWRTAHLAAGAGLVAVDALSAGAGDAAFVVARPPGHHALPSRGMGFCLLNNVAVAAAALAQ
ncbi:MAG TPA: hypothetical protein VKQ71_11805, partial [Acidimicrobiales bacterium]|nr:hypothetical protein [Acidimicrobiales bacterium]